MATLVLTAVGSAIGGPVGGSIGALIGQQIDMRIFSGGARQGPRLRELTIASSSYGQPIPRQFGRMRVPGSVIWSTDLIESKRKQKGRKGQPSTVVYSYTASFAVALSSTPIARLGKVWADGNLLRGVHGDLKTGGSLRFYQGFGDDPLDPLIAAAKGNQAPAFRDCAYVVFEDLDLGDYGNRIPALSFEIFAEGGDDSVSLAQLVPDARPAEPVQELAHARGFADEGGALASTLVAIHQVIPLVCMSGSDGLTIAQQGGSGQDILTLPQQLAGDEPVKADPGSKQRSGAPALQPAALRYYDEERDYQTGVQRALGAKQAGRELMIDLPATMTADGARQLANEAANRARWQHETVRWRIGELDPRIVPGTIVRLPEMPGKWLMRSWEWLDRGVELELERLSPDLSQAPTSDPGESLQPSDLPIPETRLLVVELPSDAKAGPDQSQIFAAASAANGAWRGAALFAVQGTSLAELGSTGSQRAIMGILEEPLPSSLGLVLERTASIVIALVANDLALDDSDISGLAAGANRVLIGDEVMQFLQAEPLGAGRWRLNGLLRGRAGTEPAALRGHPGQTPVLFIDDSLSPLDPQLVPPVAASRVAAIGIGDPEPVIAPLANPGLWRRPLCPVHPKTTTSSDGSRVFRWTRRARGQWRWDNEQEVPLVEERELYLVGYGPVESPRATWQRDKPWLQLTVAELNALVTAHGAGSLWVRQIGTYDSSSPLLLTVLS